MRQRISTALEWAVIAAALVTIPLTIAEEQGGSGATLTATEWVVWLIFALEFGVVLSTTSSGTRSTWAILSRLAVVVLSFPPFPNFLALTSLARLARLLRLLLLTGIAGVGLSALKAILGRRGLVHVAAVTTLLILAGGGCLSIIEPQTVKGGFGDGVWWAIVTASTVGYGDIAPSTVPGRIIAALLMIVGIGLMSTLAASITTYFVHQTNDNAMAEVLARLEKIEQLLEDSKTARNETPAKSSVAKTTE
jgi:voltage-gated potassium channel